MWGHNTAEVNVTWNISTQRLFPLTLIKVKCAVMTLCMLYIIVFHAKIVIRPKFYHVIFSPQYSSKNLMVVTTFANFLLAYRVLILHLSIQKQIGLFWEKVLYKETVKTLVNNAVWCTNDTSNPAIMIPEGRLSKSSMSVLFPGATSFPNRKLCAFMWTGTSGGTDVEC